MPNNENRNRARAASLRKKHAKDFDEKILSLAKKNPYLIELLENKKSGLGLSVDEVIDYDTGEVYTNENFFQVLNNMKPQKNKKDEQQKKETSGEKNKWKERFRRK